VMFNWGFAVVLQNNMMLPVSLTVALLET